MSNSKVSIVFSVEAAPGDACVMKYGTCRMAKESDRAKVRGHKEPLTGSFRVVMPCDQFFGGTNSRDYVGKILIDPTWRQLKSEALKAAKRTGDLHHVYLEGVKACRSKRDDGTTELTLLMGS